MSSFNGIGTKFSGVSKPLADDSFYATKWVVFLFLPIIPLHRARLKITDTQQDWSIYTTYYLILSKEPLRLKEVLSTYLFGWILFPLMGLAPLLICIPEIQHILGINIPTSGLLHPSWGDYFMLGAIVWTGIAAVKLRSWDRKRFL